MKRIALAVLGTLLLSTTVTQAAYNNLDDVVVGMTTGSEQYYYIRSGSTLDGIASAQEPGLNVGAVLKDGNFVLGTTGQNGLVVIRNGQTLGGFAADYWGSDIVAMAACPDGNVVFATAAGNIYKRSGTNLGDIASSLGYGAGVIADLAVAPNGNIIVGCNNGTMYVRNAMLEGLAVAYGYGEVTAVAVQPNGNIVIGNAAGNLWVRNGMLEGLQADSGYGAIVDIAVQSNGNVVVGSADGTLRIRDGSNIGVGLGGGGYDPIYRVACQRDDDIVVASNYNGGTLWLADGTTLATKASSSGYYQIKFLGVQVGEPPAPPAEPEVARFAPGWYDNADWELSTPAIIANGGTKFVVLYASVSTTNEKIQQYLDSAQSLGVRVVLSVKEIVETGNMTNVMARVNAFKSHPALAGWYMMDEPYGSEVPVANCEAAYTLIKQASDKLIYAAFYNGDLEHNTPYTYRNAYDIMMYDNYPFNYGDALFSGLSGWKSGCDLARSQALAIGKPFDMILQGYGNIPSIGWDNRLPTLAEERFMVFYSLFNGARSVEFFSEDARPQSVADANAPYPYDGIQWMGDVGKPMMMEMNRIGFAVNNGPVANGVSDNCTDVRSNVYQDPVTGQYYLLALNDLSGNETATFTLNLPSQFAYAIPLFEESSQIAIVSGVFSDTFGDYETHAYLLTTDPAPQQDNVVVGNDAGVHSIRSGLDLSWKADSIQAYASAGAVLTNGNIVVGSTIANSGCVSIRDKETLGGLVGDYWGSTVVAMAACPDGNVVFATEAGNIYKRSGTDLGDIASSLGYVCGSIADIAVAPNGNVIVGCNNGAVYVRNSMLEGVADGWGFGTVTAVAVQPDGDIVIGNAAGTLWVRDGMLGAKEGDTGYGSITDIAVQPDGDIVVASAEGDLRLRDGNNIATSVSMVSDLGSICRLACLPNGDVVVASDGHSGEVRILDANDLTVAKAYDTGYGNVKFLATQAPPAVTVLAVDPSSQNVGWQAGSTTFAVNNTGSGTMAWTAEVVDGAEWLHITSGSGTNAGTISVDVDLNGDTVAARTGTIRITAAGATGSPVDVTVVQAKHPWPGDSNEDGVVNFSDYLDFSVGFGSTGTPGTMWGQGDFNEDGVVNFSDYLVLSSNFGSGGAVSDEEVAKFKAASADLAASSEQAEAVQQTLPCTPLAMALMAVIGLALYSMGSSFRNSE